jgi:signal transduction histidine kinase
MIAAAHARIARLLTRLTALLAVLTACGPVVFFAGYSYLTEADNLDKTLHVQSIALERFINLQPDYWEINADRMRAGFEPYTVEDQAYRILNGKGIVVFAGGMPSSWPMFYRTRPLLAFGEPVGAVEAGISATRHLVVALILLAASLGIAWLVWGPMRRLPLEALSSAETAVREYQNHLEDMVRMRTEELRIARDAAEAANRTNSAFLASMSHELRTPLNAVMGFAQLLSIDARLPKDARDMADEIDRAGNRLLSMVDDLIDVADIASGNFRLIVRPVALRALIADSMNAVAELAAGNSVELCAAVCPEELARLDIAVDDRRVRQVLVSLLTNAVKYNRPRGQVSLSCERRNEAIRIAVADTGAGIPTDKQARLFTAFDRLGAECGPVLGAGVGLYLAKRIVEAMGGAIGFTSVEGQGSTFWVEFPVGGIGA